MPKYYCDYCDAFLTHDSPSVRKTHNGGRKHKENVRMYYQAWMEQQAQKLVDATARAFTQQRMLNPGMAMPPGMAMGMPRMFPPGMRPGMPFPYHPGMPPMGMPMHPMAMHQMAMHGIPLPGGPPRMPQLPPTAAAGQPPTEEQQQPQ